VTCEQLKLQPKQGAPKDARSLNSGDKNMPPNFNDRVAVKRTVGLLRTLKLQHNGEFNGNENIRWPGHIERMIIVSQK
jgi:hypothetical protein